MMEIKQIENLENYFVSENGDVFKKLKPWNNSGYLYVKLNGKHYGVHRLVASCFCEKNIDDTDVNHINGNKHDNNKNNLEWCTKKENINHGQFVLGISPIHNCIECSLFYKDELIGKYPTTKKAIEVAKLMGAKPAALQKYKIQGDFKICQEGVTTIP